MIYDELGRTDQIDHFADTNEDGNWDSGERRLAAFDYSYSVHNQQTTLLERFDTDNNSAFDRTHEFAWEYDDLGRLGEIRGQGGDKGSGLIVSSPASSR